ncbi:MAG: type II toxin-antitoxin system RelE/ParE family toxin [Deltaproteobacteria bacterium]|nr:type II toxin-antitoxin system RelE/ParE family toxin [Deltaproteobacteria bacterium]
MKSYRFRFTPEASSLIAKLPPEVKKLVRSAIDELPKAPYQGSELTGEFAGYRSLKPGRYRIIYRVNEEESFLEIYHVGHRTDVYETLHTLLVSLREKE